MKILRCISANYLGEGLVSYYFFKDNEGISIEDVVETYAVGNEYEVTVG